jgi:hypothetical protein
MKEIRDLLLSLQDLDDTLDELRREAEAIPARKRDLEEEVRAEEAGLEKAKEDSEHIAIERKDQELELESVNEKMTKFQTQLYQVKTNREYEALQHEIGDLKEKAAVLEDRILESLERAEESSTRIEREEQALEKERARVQEEEAGMDQRLKELQDRIAVKEDERVRLVADMDPVLLKRYERIRENKDGLAVTYVKNGACGGCFRQIPPHEQQRLKKEDRIISCEGCGRILIWRWE